MTVMMLVAGPETATTNSGPLLQIEVLLCESMVHI